MLKYLTESERAFVSSTAVTCGMFLVMNAWGISIAAMFAAAVLLVTAWKVIWGYKHGAAAKPKV